MACVAQAGLQLTVPKSDLELLTLVLTPLKCLDYRCASPHLVLTHLLSAML